MNFVDIIRDVTQMQGLPLASIKPGAEITIKSVNTLEENLVIETKGGGTKTRSFSELESLWDALSRQPAIHVDTVLSGSGSSRNQPETILANLPYVEWLRIEGKKYIALVPRPMHSLGTLKEMDALKAADMRRRVLGTTAKPPVITTVVLSDDLGSMAKVINDLTGVALQPVSPGAYRLKQGDHYILFLTTATANGTLRAGTYPVLTAPIVPAGGKSVLLGEDEFWLVTTQAGVFLVYCPVTS